MAVFPLLALPPEERLAFEVRDSSELVPPESGRGFLAACVSPRRLTEPPRTCGVGERMKKSDGDGHRIFCALGDYLGSLRRGSCQPLG